MAEKRSPEVEEYRKELLKKVDGIYSIVKCCLPVDPDEHFTKEEMLAIKSGILSGFGYVVALLGGDGESTEKRAHKVADMKIAESTFAIGMAYHHEQLEEFGL